MVYGGVDVKSEWLCIIYNDENHNVIQEKENTYSVSTYVLNITDQYEHGISELFFTRFYKGSNDDIHKHGQYSFKAALRRVQVVISK